MRAATRSLRVRSPSWGIRGPAALRRPLRGSGDDELGVSVGVVDSAAWLTWLRRRLANPLRRDLRGAFAASPTTWAATTARKARPSSLWPGRTLAPSNEASADRERVG